MVWPFDWDRRAQRTFAVAADEHLEASAEVDVSKVLAFLRMRGGADGVPVSHMVGPHEFVDAWFRLP